MEKSKCGLLETASSVVVMQAVTEQTDAILKEKTCLASSSSVQKACDNTKYNAESPSDDSTHF